MRFVMINLFLICLLMLGISYLAFSHDNADTHHAEDALWGTTFQTFYELLKTDREAARLELQSVAKKLFEDHPHTGEWVELFFRLSQIETKQDATENFSDIISDTIRVYKIGIQMLTAVDAEKYAKEIQLHQEALEYYTGFAELAAAFGDKPPVPEKVNSRAQEATPEPIQESSDLDKQDQIGDQHIKKFYELVPTDPEAARKELNTHAAISYLGHPLTEEWVNLLFRMSTEKAATPSDVIRFLEILKQIRTDMDPEKYATEIQELADNIEQLKSVAKFYERNGMSDAKIPFNPTSGNDKSEQKEPSGASKPSHSLKIGEPATDFQAIDLNGQELSLKKYRGQVVLLDFWATWCFPCLAEIPHIKKVYDKYKDQKFVVIGISLDSSRVMLEEYIEKENITWHQFLDEGGTVAKMYNVSGIPATFLIDGEGIIRKVKLRGNALEAAVAELVKENLAKPAGSDTSDATITPSLERSVAP